MKSRKLTFIQYHHVILPIVKKKKIFFFCFWIQPRIKRLTYFWFLFSLFQPGMILQSSLSFMTSIFLRISHQLFCRISLIFGLYDISLWFVDVFCREYQGNVAVFLSACHMKGHTLSTHPILVMFISISGQSQADVLKIMTLRLNATTPGMKVPLLQPCTGKWKKNKDAKKSSRKLPTKGNWIFSV